MLFRLHSPCGDRTVILSLWDRFSAWVEEDATQLGIGLTTYYLVCAVLGLIQGVAIGSVIIR